MKGFKSDCRDQQENLSARDAASGRSEVYQRIDFVTKNGLRWHNAPKEYGPHKTLCNRFIRWSRVGVFGLLYDTVCQAQEPPGYRVLKAEYCA